MRRQSISVYATVLAVSLLLSSCVGKAELKKPQQMDEETTIQETEVSAGGKKAEARLEDDYYAATNRDILNQIKIPSDEAGWTWFYELGNQAYEKLNKILLDTVNRREQLKDGSSEQKIAAVYLTALDSNGRNSAGFGDLLPYLTQITSAETIEEYIQAIASIQKETGYSSLIPWQRNPDLKDSSRQAAYVAEPDLVLSRSILMSEDHKEIWDKYKIYISQLLEASGDSHEQAVSAAEDIFQFQRVLVDKTLPPSEARDPANQYHPYTVEELKKLFTNMDLDTYLSASGMDQAKRYIVINPEMEETVNSYLTKDHLSLLKNYSKFILIHDNAQYLTIQIRDQKLQFEKVLNGKAEVYSDRKLAGKQTQSLLGFEFGKIYGKQYFSEVDKKNVESMVKTILQTYESQIDDVSWMSDDTKTAAKKKLETMTLKIGYPDQWPKDLDTVHLKYPEDGGVFIDNVLAINRAHSAEELRKMEKPTDQREWYMTPQTVNAYYNPQGNEIVFPAAILQPPFYDDKGNYKQNLGGIGIVIAHEITHAFDNTGAQYDEQGNYNNWWTKEDYEEFEKRQKAVAEYYNTYEGIDGQLTLGENIADLGAMSCVTKIAGEDDKNGLKKLFEQYAYIWANKYTPEEEENRLKNDPHAPGKVRVNAVLSSLDSFYKVYEIRQTDNMYAAPESRVTVWGQINDLQSSY